MHIDFNYINMGETLKYAMKIAFERIGFLLQIVCSTPKASGTAILNVRLFERMARPTNNFLSIPWLSKNKHLPWGDKAFKYKIANLTI